MSTDHTLWPGIDAIGFSTLVCLLNNGRNGATETAAALLGPFWRMRSPRTENGGSILRSPTPGPALLARCRVLDPQGRPLAGVEVDVWQASPVGLYENQDPAQAEMNLRGKFTTDAAGRFWFRSVKPAGYPVPTDGPVGDLLRAQRRHPYRPAHLHFLGFKEGYKTCQFLTDDHMCSVYEARPHDCRGYVCWNQPDETVYGYAVFLQTPVGKLREVEK